MKKIYMYALLIGLIGQTLQAEIYDEIIVTGSRITRGDYYDMPAVTIVKNANFLIQKIKLINDSRSPELRKIEIIKTIEKLILRSKKIKGIELSYGEGFLLPVKLDDDSLQIIEDRKKKDTSYVNLYVKVALQKERSAKQQISEIREFVSGAGLVSRTELISIGDIGLSIVDPEQYRYDILKKIKIENDNIKKAIGESCEISIGGLEGRVEWERSGVSELTLYIGYATDVICK